MRIFVNYIDTDQVLVNQLGQWLHEMKIEAWVDTPQPGGSREWQMAIVQGVLADCTAVINVVSAAAVQDIQWGNIVDWATGNGKPIINLATDPLGVPTHLQDYPIIDAQAGWTSTTQNQLGATFQLLKPQAAARQTERSSNEPIAVNDLPQGEDELGFQDYAAAFAEMVTNPNITPPLTIGIYGAWGTGKTFLMHKIAEEVQRVQEKYQREKRRFQGIPPARSLVINFDAWAYNTSDVLWAGLVEQIFAAIEGQLSWFGKLRLTIARNLAKEGRQLVRQIIYFTLLIIAVIVPLYFILRELDYKAVASILPFLGLPFLVRLGRDVTQLVITPQSRQVATLLASSTRVQRERRFIRSVLRERERGIIARVYDDMDKMLQALPPNTRLVIFIDDLDRCSPDRVIEVLEAINLLLAFKEFVVFLALDTRIVTSIIESNYEDTLRRAGISGYEYLDKIVQIPFTIPKARPADLLKYLNTLIEAPSGETDTAIFKRSLLLSEQTQQREGRGLALTDLDMADAHPATPAEVVAGIEIVAFTLAERSAFRAFSRYMDPNPRYIKRLVNIYRLVRTLDYRSERITVVEEAPAMVVLWLLLCQQWPYATAHLLDALRRAPANQAVNLQELYATIADKLDNDPRHRQLDYDNFTLDDLMRHYGTYITGADIHRLQALTLNFHPALTGEIRAFLD